VLKAHTANRAGRVLLRSADPRDAPDISFHYFEEGSDAAGEDLDAVVTGIEVARSIMHRVADYVDCELVPGDGVRSRQALRSFVRDQAWGHHASCTCAMGPASDRQAVVGSDFRVHGTRNLRVVDASVFPRIPGFFLVTAVYMAAEKASAVIARDAAAQAPSAGPEPARADLRRVLAHLPRPRKPHRAPALQGHRAAQENR
jgi:choline dehydrogenase-like flavoprotein